MPAKKKRILIVEDERPIAKALGLKLEHEGYEVEIAGNGEEGLAKLDGSSFDMMLLDLVMPKVDGFGVLEALKEKKSKIPVYVLSNLSQQEDSKKAESLGAKGFFIKSDTPLANIVTVVKKELGA